MKICAKKFAAPAALAMTLSMASLTAFADGGTGGAGGKIEAAEGAKEQSARTTEATWAVQAQRLEAFASPTAAHRVAET